MDHPSAWEAQKSIGCEFLSSQRSMLTITPWNTQSSSRRISYPRRRRSAQVQVSQTGFTSDIPPHTLTYLNPLAMPMITPSHQDPKGRQLDSGEQQASTRPNMATRLEHPILGRSCALMSDWTIFFNPFPDPISLIEKDHTSCSDALTQLGFPDFAYATPTSTDQASYP